MKLWRNSVLVLCAIVMGGCATVPSRPVFQATAEQARLTELMVQRLEVSRQVAWIKYVSQLPVKDPAREAQVLASLTEQGSKLGLNPAGTQEFFGAQILASRQTQEQLIHKWERGATLPAYPPYDLKRHIRPRLDYIGQEILHQLKVVKLPDPALAGYATAQIRQRGFSGSVARTATIPLR